MLKKTFKPITIYHPIEYGKPLFTLYNAYFQSMCVHSILTHLHTLHTIAFNSAHFRTVRVPFLEILPHPHLNTSPGPQK